MYEKNVRIFSSVFFLFFLFSFFQRVPLTYASSQYPVTDLDWVFSPYNWYSDGSGSLNTNNIKGGSTYTQAVNPGAYFKVGFSGTSATLNIDTSYFGNIQAKQFPRVSYNVDGGAVQTYQIKANDTQISLAQGLKSDNHQLNFWLLSSDAYVARWNASMSLKVTGLVLDNGATTNTPSLQSKKLLVFGDSITEGAWILGDHADLTNYSNYEESTSSYVAGIATDISTEYGTAAFGGQSWGSIFNGDVPSLPNAWSYYYSTNSRLVNGVFSPTPDYVLINMGTNGGVSSATVVSNWLTNLRTAAGTASRIFVVIPFNGTGRTNITQGFNSYQSSSSDDKVFLIDLGSDGNTYSTSTPTYSYDGLHPNTAGHAQLRTLLYAAIKPYLPSVSTVSSAAPICNDNPPGKIAPWLYKAVAQGPNSILLSFTDALSPVDKYVLEYGLATGKYIYGSPNIGGNGTKSYLVQSLAPGTTYYFKIRGGNGCATGPWSNEISAKTNESSNNKLESLETSPEPVKKKEMLEKTYDINVKVTDTNGLPIVGAKVILHSTQREAFTNSEGVTTFEKVEEGPHKVIIAYNNLEGVQDINLTGDTKKFDINVQVKPTNTNPLILVIGILILIIIFLLTLFIRKRSRRRN